LYPTLRPLAIGVALGGGLLLGAGCGSNCGTNCPINELDVLASPGENLNVLNAQWTGPACQSELPACRDDGVNNCVRFTILPVGEGTCQLDLTFIDGRPPVSVVATFGPETHQGCCHGFPLLGTAPFVVPPLGSTPADAGSDVPISDDGGADGGVEAGVDAGDGGAANQEGGSADAGAGTD
jgi:hypothetical protein